MYNLELYCVHMRIVFNIDMRFAVTFVECTGYATEDMQLGHVYVCLHIAIKHFSYFYKT